ncbi:MAG: DUF433 domain-containing protein [Acidobacteria bacterium]|nr:DUF433 domain-containing protein [Acidobacteriota bacterium]
MATVTLANSLPVQSDPEIMGGVPVFVGTRVPARTLFDYLADGNSLNEFLDDFPSVNRKQAVQLLEYSAELLPGVHTRPMMERWGKLEEMDRSFDIQYWQSQKPSARLAAVWELVVTAYAFKGQDANAFRLARHIENFQPVQG